jgi:valyl-tRNA synthetase
MTKEVDLPKAYDPKVTDKKWYQFWEMGKFFEANSSSPKPSYSIVIPPPNVTGALHMGHALVNTLQDILIRWKRMSGYEALWIPGTDHAGIATQTVVERHLMTTLGKRRDDLTREEFLNHVWDWKKKYEERILLQLKQLGCSCDWSRLRFTMDSGCNQAVKTFFKRLYDEGLIYRGNYLVNWDPLTQTALADDEVEYEDREGFLWYFKYPFTDGSGFAHIATTRPETMLGDTAVAVSPKDTRYHHLIGKTVRLPILNREIPIIADHHVDPTFGTGMVKVTPAHDPDDYRIGINHQLPQINILTPQGYINENGGPFKGMSREQARKEIVQQMQHLGLLEKIDRHSLRVGISYRSKAIIEPFLSMQWFVKMETFKEVLSNAVKEGEVKILPPSWEQTYFHWINHLRDWCISRQLWWGHRIPVWHHHSTGKMICYDGQGEPPEVVKNPEEWEQDPDVLDTWFSAALWPFSTLGWPKVTPDLHKFYPTSVLVTGHDILFFWVARMILMGKYATGKAPFPETFLHGLIYGKSYWRENQNGGITYVSGKEKKDYDLGKPLPSDVRSKWEKLSKSKGNVIDPLEMIEEYGTDAVRMSLCASANQTPQIDLDRRRFEEFKNFANKIWNGARFIFLNLEGLTDKDLSEGLERTALSLEDRWILSLLNRVNRDVNEYLSRYSFDQAAQVSYEFFWKEFCAYYLEISKPVLFGKIGGENEKRNKQKILVHVLCNAIRLLHPMAPFITEELFQLLKNRFPQLYPVGMADPYTLETIKALSVPSCMVSLYPKVIDETDIQPEIEAMFASLEKMIYSIRNIRGEMKIPPHVATDIYIVGTHPTIEQNLNIIEALVKTNKIHVTQHFPSLNFAASCSVENLTILIPVPKELADREAERLKKEAEKLEKSEERLLSQLSNQEFLEKAKPELIEKQKTILLQTRQELKAIHESLQKFGIS